MMELCVNSNKKKSLQKQNAKSRKGAYVIATIAKVLLYAGLIGGTLYIFVCFVSPSMWMREVRGVLEKDVNDIIITSSFIFVPCLIFSLCLNVMSKNLAGIHSSVRVNEQLIITDKIMQYSYRVKYQSASHERRLITFDLSKITVYYEDKTDVLIFIGNSKTEYFDDYRSAKPVDTDYIEEFIIFDYFSPSLKETLSTMGMVVTNVEMQTDA